MTVEIERKYLVRTLPPDADLGAGEILRQGYLAEEGDVAVRVRTTESAATVTIKAGRGVSRVEIELPVSRRQADALWPYTEGRRIEKRRHRIGVPGGFVAEVDRYGGALAGLCTVEVEFDDVASADAFTAPEWFGTEVTDDGRWTNAALARHGRPDDS